MRDPIEHLLSEHKVIMAKVDDLRRAVSDLENRGDAALPETLPVFEAVGRMMESQLHAHARKEDDGLFPALEEVFGREGTPTAVMREEHRAIHAESEQFRRTLRELNEIEHPAIVAEGETLRGLTSRGAGAEELRATGTEIIRLLDLHFRKEETILFPMARRLLGPDALRAVDQKMEEIEKAHTS